MIEIKLYEYDADSIEAAIRTAGCQQVGMFEDILPIGARWAVSQSPKEAAAALAKWHALGVRSVLEIGTYTGGFARFMAEVMGWDVVSIDVNLPDNPPRGFTFVHKQSGQYEPERRFDLVYIDGDHRYESVKADYERFAPYADKVVALHDVLGNHDCEGVRRLFNEIRSDDWTVEVSTDWPLGIAWREVAASDEETPEPVKRKGSKR